MFRAIQDISKIASEIHSEIIFHKINQGIPSKNINASMRSHLKYFKCLSSEVFKRNGEFSFLQGLVLIILEKSCMDCYRNTFMNVWRNQI